MSLGIKGKTLHNLNEAITGDIKMVSDEFGPIQ